MEFKDIAKHLSEDVLYFINASETFENTVISYIWNNILNPLWNSVTQFKMISYKIKDQHSDSIYPYKKRFNTKV